ncbi:ATP-binding protein [Kitasatospora sp. NPDC059646]|uniref:ATP-binding protein n=1 Tax=Kitasatospora sp. NPDC059646 TaxID=3346893 RepID=UPI0036B307B9
MSFTFAPATREKAMARIALEGPSGSGKTFTALTLATALADRVALVDTERGSASKYAVGTSGGGFAFDTVQLSKYDPRDLPGILAAAARGGYGAVVVDSLSHFWMGTGGMLEMVDSLGKRSGAGGSFGGWKEARPVERAMIEALLAYPGHVIVTMRTKSEWVIEEDERGKKQVRKIGTKAEQREGLEYEFDLVGDLDQENTLVVTKSRCPELAGAVIRRPGPDMAATMLAWLQDGTAVPDVSDLLDQAADESLTYEGALALHASAEQHRLLGAAILHPVTAQPTTFSAYLTERGKALRAAQPPAAPDGPTAA